MRFWFVVLVLGFVVVGAAGQSSLPVMEKPSFEVSTVKPAKADEQGEHWHFNNNRMEIGNYTLLALLKVAYGVKADAGVLQLPDWARKERFDLSAKLDDAEFKKLDKLTGEAQEQEMEALLQSLLSERFHVVGHVERRTVGVFALLPDKAGAKLTASKVPPAQADGKPDEPPHNTQMHDGHMEATGTDMDLLAKILSDRYETGKRVVLDKTGLTGYFDFTLDWAPDRGSGISPEATKPDLMTALQEQLGLRLEKQDAEVPVLVVESVGRPEFD